MEPSDDITLLIEEWRGGSREAGDLLIAKLYPELKRIARAHLKNERQDHTLAPTALVNELYLRFIRSGSPLPAQNRIHFLALAAQSLRHILVDHARMHAAKKRADGLKLDLSSADAAIPAPDQDLLVLHQALIRLESLDARAGRVVELRFFGGLNEEEVAEILGVSRKTVQRDWKTARAWLIAQFL
jgi:RNA polymerase sigma factor (TIGR02999 family)